MIKKILFLILFVLSVSVFSYEKLPDVLTIKKVIKNMQEAFVRIKTYKAKFKIVVQDNKKKISYGTVKFKTPDKIIFLFERPEDQLIYSDGEVLKIYLPDLKIVGEQRLNSNKQQDLMFVNSKNSYYQLIKQYNFSFPEKYIKTYNGEKIYILHLTQKNVYSGFKNIDLWISSDWIILKARGETREGKIVTISFSDIVINDVISDNEFNFDLPVDVQTVINPLYDE